jgi:hypothetical protein
VKELYLIATNPNNPLEIRYDAIRLMQHKKVKIPFWKYRVLNLFIKKNLA